MEVESRARQLANLKPFQPDQSGNPHGRPVQRFLADVEIDRISWDQFSAFACHGVERIA
jgi:hypothetical protein